MFVPLMYSLAQVPRHQGPIAPSELTALFRGAIKHPQVRLSTKRSALVSFNQVSVGGDYDPEDDKLGDPCIQVYLLYHSSQQHLELNVSQWRRLCFDIAECIGHELVHRAQAKRRKYKLAREYLSRAHCSHQREEQQYLGSPDEIEAYGFSIAAELAAMHGCFSLEEIQQHNIMMYQVYTSTFDNDQSVVLKLQHQISKYLRRLEADYYDQQSSKRSTARGRARST